MAETGYEILTHLADGEEKLTDALLEVREMDEQSGKLMEQVGRHLSKALDLSEGDAEALRRFLWVVNHAKTSDSASIRNFAFKAANAAGLKLPSGSF